MTSSLLFWNSDRTPVNLPSQSIFWPTHSIYIVAKFLEVRVKHTTGKPLWKALQREMPIKKIKPIAENCLEDEPWSEITLFQTTERMGLTVKGFLTFACIIDAGWQLLREKTPSRIPLFPQDRASLTPKLLQMLESMVAVAVSLLLQESFVTFKEEPSLGLICSSGCKSWLQRVIHGPKFSCWKNKVCRKLRCQ